MAPDDLHAQLDQTRAGLMNNPKEATAARNFAYANQAWVLMDPRASEAIGEQMQRTYITWMTARDDAFWQTLHQWVDLPEPHE
jgi:hypothetical protein